ncbi:MAG: hypothetical protein M1837_006207 [Sclerophora amabilis]|nr:MAG: hypothetical protein M1837_006207 [Sclerophora amabilis]
MTLFSKSTAKKKRKRPAAKIAPPEGQPFQPPPQQSSTKYNDLPIQQPPIPQIACQNGASLPSSYSQPALSRPRRSSPVNPGWARSQPTIPLAGPAVSQPFLPPQTPPSRGLVGKTDATWKSFTNLAATLTGPTFTTTDCGEWHQKGAGYINQGAALCDLIGSKLDSVITLIDGERFSGDERELAVDQHPPLAIRGGGGLGTRAISRGANDVVSNAITSTNYFIKVNLYLNSRLPPNLPPLKLRLSTFPLISLAAQYSHRVYTRPIGAERDTHVEADWRMGTKAMVIKSVPNDAMNTIVFAIRGTQTFMDWAVNLNSAPASPTGFLDDPGNLCHSGFLSVARKMVKPVASRLRHLLEEDPSRASCSLLITGHSAGGAVAGLLYAHMLAERVKSELNFLTGCFKRVHCITFGSPPVSLLPIQKPHHHRLRKSLFLSFINEGDPVPRADKAYVRSLLDLYTSPSPGRATGNMPASAPLIKPKKHRRPLKNTDASGQCATTSRPPNPPSQQRPVWPVPPSTLSNAGRLVLLRTFPNNRPSDRARKAQSVPTEDQDERTVHAFAISDAQLRPVIFGDPLMHMMQRYARRIEIMATNAVLVKT